MFGPHGHPTVIMAAKATSNVGQTPVMLASLWQAGVLQGQRLYEISDPIRADEMWVLNDRPSLRFVRDAFSMRRSPTIDLVLSRMPEAEPVSPPSSSTASGGSEESEPGMPVVSAAQHAPVKPLHAAFAGPRVLLQVDVLMCCLSMGCRRRIMARALTGVGPCTLVVSRVRGRRWSGSGRPARFPCKHHTECKLGTAEKGPDNPLCAGSATMTVGERLALQQERLEEEERQQMTALQRRQRRRLEYMEVVLYWPNFPASWTRILVLAT